MDTTNLISPRQAARELHVSTDTLRRWAEEGKIAAVRTIGGHRRYRRDQLAELAAIHRSFLPGGGER